MMENVSDHERLVMGEITIADYVGLNKERQYEIAMKGYHLMETGRLDEAETIYRGLVAADPFDSVFHSQLGAICFRKQDFGGAFQEFDDSIRLNKCNVDALAARGELFLMRQDYEAGIEDLKNAVENDPEGKKQSSIRARAILLSLRDAVETRRRELAADGH
ncbi:MAG: tetratricopeptide repeat protein [Pyrinomonadaceae bacterium]